MVLAVASLDLQIDDQLVVPGGRGASVQAQIQPLPLLIGIGDVDRGESGLSGINQGTEVESALEQARAGFVQQQLDAKGARVNIWRKTVGDLGGEIAARARRQARRRTR